MLKIKDNVDLKELEKFGYFKSHVAVLPKKIVKQIDNEYVIEICIEEPSKNIWTNEDWKKSRIPVLCHCKKIEPNCKNIILIEPEIKEHLYYETDYSTWNEYEVSKYINDLIKANLVEEVSNE
jgi:hypothetical protein